MPAYGTLGTLSRIIGDIPWPIDFFSVDDLPDFLGKIFVIEHSLIATDTGYRGRIWLAFEKELSLDIPGLTGVSLVAGKTKDDLTFVTIQVDVGEANTIKLVDTQLALRYEGSLLTPVPTEDDPNPKAVELVLAGTVVIDGSFHATID